MITKKTIAAALFAVSALINVSSAKADAPMDEDLSKIQAAVQTTYAAGQANDAAAFSTSVAAALELVKQQSKMRSSPALERLNSHLRKAVSNSKKGDMAAANRNVEAAMEEFK